MLYLDYSNLQERRNVSKFTWLLEEVDFLFMSLSCWNECAMVLCTRGRWVPYKIKVGNFLVNMIMLFFNICQQLPMLTWIWKAADQVSLPDCLYFLRYWSRYVYTKKSRQKFKYLENKKSFEDEIKNIFHHF